MDRLRSVLVAVDFSECSNAALAQACRVAGWNGAALHVLHVIDELVPAHIAKELKITPEAARAQTRQHARHRIEGALEKLAKPAEVDVHVEFGSPIHQILARVEAVAADLLVAGVRGQHDSPGVGSLASRCVRKVPTKVMLVAGDGGGAFRNVIACVDFSETSKSVLDHAIRVARRDKGRLHVLHIYSGPWHALHYRAPTPEASVEFRTEFAAELEATLEEFLAPFRGELEGLEVVPVLHDASSYGWGIVEYAKKLESDLVVLGTRGRTNLRYVLLGSTAERVLKQTPCSVLAVKPADFKAPHR